MKLINHKIIMIICIYLGFTICLLNTTYSFWREEFDEYETKNIDSMFWLSKKRREELKKEQEKEYRRRILENQNKDLRDRKLKWLHDDRDITNYPKDKWELIDDDNDGIYYKYYFDKDGYLLIDTVTYDYNIVDSKGREVDGNLKPIEYNLMNNEEIEVDKDDSYILLKREPAKVLISEGVVLKRNEKIFDTTINNDVLDYLDKSNRFIKNVKGILYNNTRWNNCSSIKANGGFIKINNPKNNFNKISGYISTERITNNENDGYCRLKVYDSILYDMYNKYNRIDELREIFESENFYKSNPIKFNFTFDRSIEKLVFIIETDGNNTGLTCYLRNLKYGFSKSAFRDELIRKKEDEEEREELKRLGIFVEDLWLLDIVDEDGNELEYEESFDYEKIVNNTYEETKSYEDIVRDRKTGPNFDKNLNEKIDMQKIGPAFKSNQ